MERKTESASPRDSADLVTDPGVIARVESQNALKQFDFAMAQVELQIKSGKPFRLERNLIYELNRLATEGIKANAGKPRQGKVSIKGSGHQPPPWEEVPELMGDLCKYVNDNWHLPAIHLASYVMWRINWIHPFEDGNGRTSRMLSYMVLCLNLGFVLPGTRTIPDQIASNKPGYYPPLEAADAAFAKGKIDLRMMEEYMAGLLANQLLDIHEQAVGPLAVKGP